MSGDWIIVGLSEGHGTERTVCRGKLKGLVISGWIEILLDLFRLLDLIHDGKNVIDISNGTRGSISPKFIT